MIVHLFLILKGKQHLLGCKNVVWTGSYIHQDMNDNSRTIIFMLFCKVLEIDNLAKTQKIYWTLKVLSTIKKKGSVFFFRRLQNSSYVLCVVLQSH